MTSNGRQKIFRFKQIIKDCRGHSWMALKQRQKDISGSEKNDRSIQKNMRQYLDRKVGRVYDLLK